MKTMRVFVAALVVAGVVAAAAAQPMVRPVWGTAGGPTLFEPIGPDSDEVIMGFRFALVNASAAQTGQPFEAATRGALVMEVTHMIEWAFAVGGPCEEPAINVTAMTDNVITMWDEDHGRKFYAIMMLARVTPTTGNTLPLSRFPLMLHSCIGEEEEAKTDDLPSTIAANFQGMHIGARPFGSLDHLDRAVPPRMRLQAFGSTLWSAESDATAAAAAIRTPFFKVFFGMCLEDQVKDAMEHMKQDGDDDDKDDDAERIDISNIHWRWTDVETDDDTGMGVLTMKVMVDLMWEASLFQNVDDRTMPGDFADLDVGECFDEAAKMALGPDSNFAASQGWDTALVSSEAAITNDESRGGVGTAKFTGAATMLPMLEADNYRMMEFVAVAALDNARRNKSSTMHATPAWVDIVGAAPIGNDLVVSFRVTPGRKRDDFFQEDDITAAIEQGFVQATSGTPTTFFDVDGYDMDHGSMWTYAVVDVAVEDNRAGADEFDGGALSALKPVISAANWAVTGDSPMRIADCADCDWWTFLRGDGVGNYSVNVDWDVDAIQVGATTAIFRFTVMGHMQGVSAFLARWGDNVVPAGTVRAAMGCVAGTPCDVDVELVRVSHTNAFVGNVFDGHLNTAETMMRVGGISFSTANSAEFRMLAEAAGDWALSEANVPTHPGEGSDWLNTHLLGCAFAAKGIVDCEYTVATGNWSAVADYNFADVIPAEAVGNATRNHLFAGNQLRDAMHALAHGADFTIQSEKNPAMAGTVTLSVAFDGRAENFPLADMNSRLPAAVTMLMSLYNQTAMNAHTWSLWGCTSSSPFTACSVSFVPEMFMSYIPEESRVGFVQGAFYIAATSPLQLPQDGTDPSVFAYPIGRVIGACDHCTTSVVRSGRIAWHGYTHSFNIFLTGRIDSNPRNPAGNSILRMAATAALNNAGLEVDLAHVSAYDVGRDMQGNRAYRVHFRIMDYMSMDGMRQRLNTAIAELFSHFALRNLGTGCLSHLFKYEVNGDRFLASDICEMLFSENECRSIEWMRDNDMADNRVIDDARGNDYYVLRDSSFDDMGLQECGCDTQYSCWSTYSDHDN